MLAQLYALTGLRKRPIHYAPVECAVDSTSSPADGVSGIRRLMPPQFYRAANPGNNQGSLPAPQPPTTPLEWLPAHGWQQLLPQAQRHTFASVSSDSSKTKPRSWPEP